MLGFVDTMVGRRNKIFVTINKRNQFVTAPVFAAAVCAAILAPPAAAEEPRLLITQTGQTFLVGLQPIEQDEETEGKSASDDPGYQSALSPSGAQLPEISSYLDSERDATEVTYLTPRTNGLQFGMTHEHGEAEDGSKKKKPKSVSANFSENLGAFEFSLGGDYGSTPEPMHRGVELVEDEKLMRVGAHVGLAGFRFGGTFGGDLKPGDFGQTLSWNNFARFDQGPVSIGLVHSYTLQGDKDDDAQAAQNFGTLQGGFSYSITPNLTTSLNAAYGSYLDEDSDSDSSLAGVFGVHWRF